MGSGDHSARKSVKRGLFNDVLGRSGGEGEEIESHAQLVV